MTNLLKKLLEKHPNCQELEQNALARWLIDEIIAEKKWGKAFVESEALLEKLADEALTR